MNYAKLIGEYTLEYAPIIKDGVINYNQEGNREQLLRDGYSQVKDIIEQPSNTTKIQYYADGNYMIKNRIVPKTKEEMRELRALQYQLFVDNYVSEYIRKDATNTFKSDEEKETLLNTITTLVEEIRTNFPYPKETEE